MERSDYVEVQRSYKKGNYSIQKTFYLDKYEVESVLSKILASETSITNQHTEEIIKQYASRIHIEKERITADVE